ncbi:signal peptidase II [Thiomicrorhabdus aquaedulcis]|uniref:signal peptidase II n=1 Tax=Thiomicrorhabdus aquaedulcis TaxID=2211106 RepID=UPI000FD92F83|nr:signal peptidase II [Thiomicrorhabdus aquaedulcis]
MPNHSIQADLNSANASSAVRTLWFAVMLIVVDQLTKYWAVSTLVMGVPVPVMPNLNMTLVYNYGAAFSFLADMGGWQRWFFTGLAAAVTVILWLWLAKLPNRFTVDVLAINLVLGGAIGNVIDRVLAGRVTDFVDFYIGTWHYATFNVADMAITVGAILLLWSELWLKPRLAKHALQQDPLQSDSQSDSPSDLQNKP